MPSKMRGTGATSQQIYSAPHGAIYVWCNRYSEYVQDLARKLGRTDLRIETPYFFKGDRWMGTSTPVVVDHAFWGIASAADKYDAVRCLERLAMTNPTPTQRGQND